MQDTLFTEQKLVIFTMLMVRCGVFFVCPGSPFLASEDRVLGGVIVLRCCRCVEPPPSQNIQGVLGKALIIASLITLKPPRHNLQ